MSDPTSPNSSASGYRPPLLAPPAHPIPSPRGSGRCRSRPDLEAVRLDLDPAPPGGSTDVHTFVVNRGPERIASPRQITLHVPDGLTILRPSYPDDCTPSGGRVITWTFPAGLNSLETATVTISDPNEECPLALASFSGLSRGGTWSQLVEALIQFGEQGAELA